MRRILLVVLLFIPAVVAMAGWDPVVLQDTWHGHSVKFLAGVLRVRVDQGVGTSIARAQAVMPSGVTVRQQLLHPSRTRLYGSGMRRMPGAALTDPLLAAEDQLVRTFIVEFSGPVDPRRMAAKLAGSEGIEVAEPWYVDEQQATTNDPFLEDQAYLQVIKATQAWDTYSGDASMVIAVCDNGIDQSHEDLAGSLHVRSTEVPNNGLDDDDNGYVDDYAGCNLSAEIDGNPGVTYHSDSHGTEVAGLVGATWNNGKGIAGIAGQCKIYPLKVSISGRSGVVFGYQGILYAANNGFKVVNCSWGTVKPYSIIDQSIIDYAVAKGTVIVASAGNHGNRSGATPFDRNYPSAYRGVFGVGETTLLDRVTSSSGLGENVDVLAPGYEAYTTTLGNSYTSFMIQGTSFASPMAAAMLGLIRAKHPQLTPEQAMAFARRCVDDVRGENSAIAPGLPGRINLVRAVTDVPGSVRGVELLSYRLLGADGRPLSRIPYQTPLRLSLSVHNALASVAGMVTEVRILQAGDWTVSLPVAEGAPISMAAGERRTIDDLRIAITKEGERPLMLAVRFLADGLDDERIILIGRQSNMTTMENPVLAYSIGDAGALGVYGDPGWRLGSGFNWKPFYTMMSPSGLVITESDQRALTGMNDIGVTSDFSVEKPFVEPDSVIGILTDTDASPERRIGVRVRQRVTFHPVHPNATLIHIAVTNTSGRALSNVSVGYLLDWDLGTGGQANRSRLAPEGIPESFAAVPAAVQVFYRTTPPVRAAVMCGVVAADPTARAQAAAFPYGDILSDGLSTQEMIDLLRNDEALQTDLEDDLAGLVGMRFPGVLPNDATRDYLMIFVVAPTIDSAAVVMRDVMSQPLSVDVGDDAPLLVLPNPANETAVVEHGSAARRILVHDVQGSLMHVVDVQGDVDRTTIPTGTWANGYYLLSIEYGAKRRTVPLTILR
jgi:subtilisin family serine protease